MSRRTEPRGSIFNLIFMAGRKSLPPLKYEPLENGRETSKIDEEHDATYHNVVEPDTCEGITRRFLIICIGVCLSCLTLSIIILGATGVLLQNSQFQTNHTHAVSSNEPWKSIDPQAHRLTWAESGSLGCGHTPSEAVARSCIFDVMTTSWQHPDCYDAELNAEITALHGPWTFYWSTGPPEQRPEPEMLNIIPTKELGFYEGSFWATREYHVWHCTYAWRSMHRAVERGRKLDGFLLNYEHTAHCGRLIINASDHSGMPMDSVVTVASVKYPLC